MLAKSLLVIAIFYTALCVYAFVASDGLIFQAQSSTYRDTPEILKVRSATGKMISVLYLHNPAAQYTLLVSHGNAEDLGDDRDWLELLRRTGFSVFGYDYEGYGTSEGKPTEKSAYADELAAYQYLVGTLQVPPDRVIIMGRSVGTGPAIFLAARRTSAGLILQSPFLSAFRVLTHVPILPFDKFPNYREIRHVRCPVLIMHGSADSIIPPWHGEKLFQLANSPKQLVLLEKAGHNDVGFSARPAYLAAIKSFRDQLPRPIEAASKP